MNAFDPGFADRREELEVRLREAGDDPLRRTSILSALRDLDVREREYAAEAVQRDRAEAAKLVEGDARKAASKAEHDLAQGTLASGVVVTAEQARARMMRQLETQGLLELAADEIKARGLSVTHGVDLLAAYVRELVAADPSIEPFIERCRMPEIAPADVVRQARASLFRYVPPAPPPPPWPEPDARYVSEALDVIALLASQSIGLGYRNPITNALVAADVGNGVSPPPKESVVAAVTRGAALIFTPTGRRVAPPRLEGLGSFEPEADGSCWVYTPRYAAKKAVSK